MNVPHPSPRRLAAGALVASVLVLPALAAGQQYSGDASGEPWLDQPIEAHVWFDRGEEPLVERGERVRIYYRTSADAYVAIFNIDTNGTVRMVHPRSPEDDTWVRGGRDYRLLFPRSPYWYVDDHPGMGYFFVVASPEPLDLSAFDYAYFGGGWDLSRVGRHVYSDPYVAIDDYVAALIPDWEYVPYALDVASYHVGRERVDYPRFLCYDCHGFRSYASWNPYHYRCTTFRVVIYDDPFYYPVYRYGSTRVVYPGVRRADIPFADIPRANLPRFEFKERADGEAGSPLIATRASSGTGVRPSNPRGTPTGVRPPLRRTSDRTPGTDGRTDRSARPRTDRGGAVASPGGTVRRPVERGGTTVRPDPREGPRSRVGTPSSPVRRPTTAPDEARRGSGPAGERAGEAREERRFVPVIGAPTRDPDRARPVLERRRPSGSVSPGSRSGGAAERGSVRAPTRPPAGPSGGSRPGVRPGGAEASGGTARPSTARPGAPTRVRPRGGSEDPGRPSARILRGGRTSSGSATAPARILPRSGGASASPGGRGGTSARPPARPQARVRPDVTKILPRGSGSTTRSVRPPARVRPRGGGASTSSRGRPPVRVKSGGGTVSRGGSVGTTRSRPAPARKRPPKKPPEGGGGG